MAWTNSGLTHKHTHKTHIWTHGGMQVTIPEGQNWPQVKMQVYSYVSL